MGMPSTAVKQVPVTFPVFQFSCVLFPWIPTIQLGFVITRTGACSPDSPVVNCVRRWLPMRHVIGRHWRLQLVRGGPGWTTQHHSCGHNDSQPRFRQMDCLINPHRSAIYGSIGPGNISNVNISQTSYRIPFIFCDFVRNTNTQLLTKFEKIWLSVKKVVKYFLNGSNGPDRHFCIGNFLEKCQFWNWKAKMCFVAFSVI